MEKQKFQVNSDRKIFLVINTGYFGDVLLTSKLTRDIKKEYPDSLLLFIVDMPYKLAAEGLPGVDEIICYDRKKCHNIFHFIKFLIDFPYKNKVDFTFIPHPRKTNRSMLARLLGSKKIFKLYKFESFFDYDELMEKDPLNDRFAYRVANMLSNLTKKVTDSNDVEFQVLNFYEAKIDKYFNDLMLQDNLIAINPKAGDDWKCWNTEEVVKFAKLVMEDGKKIVLTGVLKDGTECIEALDEQIGAENYLNFVGKTSIPELGALYKKCQAVVSVDTGSMHMACAVGVPTIALFFRDSCNWWAPLKNPYIYNPDGICAETVYEELQKIIA